MNNKISVRLINTVNTLESKWFISSVDDDNPFSIIITRSPNETRENLLKEINSLPDLEPLTIFKALDKKRSIHFYHI